MSEVSGPEGTTPADAGPRIARGAALLAVYAALLGWLFYGQSTSWPHEGSWATLAYLFLCPGIVFQSFALIYAGVTGRPVTRRVLTRVVTVPLGLVLAAALGQWGSALSMEAFEQAYAPFVAQVGTSLAEPCGGAAKYFAIPAVAAYNEQAGRSPTARLKYDSKRFVLLFSGGSMDMDGSTIYFDSGPKRWRKIHNDLADASGELEKLTDGLAGCALRPVPAPQ